VSGIKKILVVDDEHLVRWSLKEILSEEGYEVETASDAAHAQKALEQDRPDLLILDYMMPEMTGMEFLARLRDAGDLTPVIMLTAVNQAQDAVKALKLGASNYLLKPVDLMELKASLTDLSAQNLAPPTFPGPPVEAYDGEGGFYGMIGTSQAMEQIYNKIQIIARSATMNVLITGESGTGKELVAQAIHKLSNRSERDMLEVNCTALTETLFASELFGHLKGSFTDAKMDKTGLLEKADKSSLFLDEIGDLSLDVQAKLLRVLEDRLVTPVGGAKGKKIDVRIITATNRPLNEAVEAGRFRRDLLHRLDIARIHLPPLRKRKEDIAPLVEHFLKVFGASSGKSIQAIHPQALHQLEAHSWSGNVRELRNVIERAVLFHSKTVLQPEHLEFTGGADFDIPSQPGDDNLSLEEMERRALVDALEETDFNISAAARKLKISRDKLRYRMKKHDL